MEDNMDAELNLESNFSDLYNFPSIDFRYKFDPLSLDKMKSNLH